MSAVATHTVEVRLYFHDAEQYAVASQDTVTIEAPDDGTFASIVGAVKEAAEKVAADRGLGFVSQPRWGTSRGDVWCYSVDLWPEKPSWVGPPRPAYKPRICMQCGADMNSTRCRHGGPR